MLGFGRLFLAPIEVRKILSTNPKEFSKNINQSYSFHAFSSIHAIHNVWLSKLASIKVLGFGRLFLNHEVTCHMPTSVR